MSIEVPAAEVRALAAILRGQSASAEEVAARLRGVGDVGGRLQSAVEAFLETHRTAARALAGELQWLGSTVAAVADSWVDLDAALLDGDRRVTPR